MKKIKGVTVAKLKALDVRAMLYCPICDSEYSANAADYWNLPDEHIFTCCGVPNKLLERITTYREVR